MAAGGGEDPGAPARPQLGQGGDEAADDTRRVTESEMAILPDGGPGIEESDPDDAASVRLDLAATLETEHEALVRAEVAKGMRVLMARLAREKAAEEGRRVLDEAEQRERLDGIESDLSRLNVRAAREARGGQREGVEAIRREMTELRNEWARTASDLQADIARHAASVAEVQRVLAAHAAAMRERQATFGQEESRAATTRHDVQPDVRSPRASEGGGLVGHDDEGSSDDGEGEEDTSSVMSGESLGARSEVACARRMGLKDLTDKEVDNYVCEPLEAVAARRKSVRAQDRPVRAAPEDP